MTNWEMERQIQRMTDLLNTMADALKQQSDIISALLKRVEKLEEKVNAKQIHPVAGPEVVI